MDFTDKYYSNALLKIFENILLVPNIKTHAKEVNFEQHLEENYKNELTTNTKYIYNQILSIIRN